VQGETVGNAGALRDRSEVRLAAAHFPGYGALSAWELGVAHPSLPAVVYLQPADNYLVPKTG